MNNNVLYLIGSLRNERIPKLAARLREEHPDLEVFDDWYAAGPEADDFWKEYEQSKGSSYQEALRGYSARNVFEYDRRHLDRCDYAILVLPAGKSGHMEIMYAQYAVKAKTAILLDPDDVRWDVMYQFIPTILNNDEEIAEWLNLPEEKTTETNLGWTYSQPPLLSGCPTSLGLGLKNMPPITGGVVSNTRDLSGLPYDTSRHSTKGKTSTPRVD